MSQAIERSVVVLLTMFGGATALLAGNGQPPKGVEPSQAHAGAVLSQAQGGVVANLPQFILQCSDSTDAPWASIGQPSRPKWVSLCAERRLRLLPALPGMKKDIQGDVDKYFGTRGPGLAVGLVLDDGLLYSQGFGFRDAKKTSPPDELTLFRAGSLSKVITGTGLLTLIDDPARQMSLDDLADGPKYLPELKYVCPAADDGQSFKNCSRGSNHLGIKLKDLVSHTAGLANVMEQTNAGISTWLSDLKKSYLLYPPEKYGAYSGIAIEGVGLIEQRVSGAASYPAFIQQNLFAPLGMTHSSMDPLKSPADLVAQRWRFDLPPDVTWTFTADGGMLAGDDQAMILPAGGLDTDVWDLARFIRMWLSGSAPIVNGHPLLKPSTIQSANLPQVSSGDAPPAGCGDKSDPNGFYYSACAPANGFGVNWYVGFKPFLMHNGDEPQYSGSQTIINQAAKIGATGLVSTEPYPRSKPQPADLDGFFMDTVVIQHLMNEGMAADAKTTWKGEPLSQGTARLLWLSGATAPPTFAKATVTSPLTVQPLGEHPNVAPRRTPQAPASRQSPKLPQQEPPKAEQTPLNQYQNKLLEQFSSPFLAQNQLTVNNVQTFVEGVFGDASRCSTFRVQRVFGAEKASLRFKCHAGAANTEAVFDVTLTVNGKGLINGLANAGKADGDY